MFATGREKELATVVFADADQNILVPPLRGSRTPTTPELLHTDDFPFQSFDREHDSAGLGPDRDHVQPERRQELRAPAEHLIDRHVGTAGEPQKRAVWGQSRIEKLGL